MVVIGGGAIGLGICWRSAREGLRVTVVDPEPGRGASWAAAGMLAPITEVHYGEEALLDLNLSSHAAYSSFVAELESDAGMSVSHRTSGTVLVARDNDDNAALSEIFRLQQRLGLDVRRLRSAVLRGLEPALVSSVRGGILVEGDHQIDNRALVEALLEACRRRGVTFVRARATALSTGDGGAPSVMLDDGLKLDPDQVVIAAGAHSAEIEGIDIPVRPVKGQLLHLRSRDRTSLLERNVRGLDVYLVPRSDGRLVVGATVEEQGFDRTVTAGAVHDLLRYAYELVPGITEFELTEVSVGHRPATPDNAPLLGPTAAPGVHLATGHYRNGILLLPVTALSMARLLSTGEVTDEIAPFSPERFFPAAVP